MSAPRLFCSTGLAARVEAAECRLVRGGVEAARTRAPEAGYFVLPLAGGAATWAGEGSPLDKVAGLGFGGVPADHELDAVERAFAAHGAPVQFELSVLGDPEISARLTRRGYQLVGFENVLGLALAAAEMPAQAPDIEVTESGGAETALWLDLVVEGFANPDTQGLAAHEEFPRSMLERAIGDLTSASGFHRYLARRGGVPAGGGSLRVDGTIAQLSGAATVPAHRRQGVQSALLAARLRAARAAGCEIAVVTTQPGSKSQQNAQRQGFELLYTRAILRK